MDFRSICRLTESSIDRWHEMIMSDKMLSAAVHILDRIMAEGYQAYIVGGAVRDIIMGEKPKDVDIATNMPVQILDTMFSTHDIGKNRDFGIVVVEYEGFNIEIAHFRQDGTYVDGRRPESVTIVDDFKSDVSRRDFTINAMGIDKDGNIIDYFDGGGDIRNKVLRTVGDASERFGEDRLRMMRAVRFASRLGFKMDPKMREAIRSGASTINDIAVERIADELRKTAGYGGNVLASAIEMMDELGLLEHILPEIVRMKEFEHDVSTHPEGGVLAHTLAALKASPSRDPIVNLSILLHDIGKINTRSYSPDNIVHYVDHAAKGVEIAEKICRRLRISNEDTEAVKFSVLNHMKFHELLKMKNSTVLKLMRDRNFDILKDVALADARARGHLFDSGSWDAVINRINELKSSIPDAEYDRIRGIVNGDRIMKLLGIGPGKRLGAIIRDVMAHVFDNKMTDSDEIDAYVRDTYGH